MIVLNLTAKTKEEKMVKDYLQNNVSNELAKKINNGVQINKDGKVLLNKKDLPDFMNYACGEAQKLAEKGARSACVYDAVVYGWAMHYFQEDEIEGKIYNMDGTEYHKEVKMPTPTTSTYVAPKKAQNNQTSMFDLMQSETKEPESDNIEESSEDEEFDEETKTEIEQEISNNEVEKQKVEKITSPDGTKEYVVDHDGVVLEQKELSSINKHTMYILYSLLDGKLEIQ